MVKPFVVKCSLFGSMTAILLGYDIGVISGANNFIQKDMNLSDGQVEVMSGILSFCSLVGAGLSGRTADLIGRRGTIAVSGVIFLIGAILMAVAPVYKVLLAGRVVAGVGVGYALVISPLYSSEIAPKSVRGLLTSFTEVFVNVGILLGYVSNLAFSGLNVNLGWRLMLGAGVVPAVLMFTCVWLLPESPRYLVMQGKVGEARKILNRCSDDAKEAEERLSDIKEVVGIAKDSNDDIVEVNKSKSHGGGVWKEIISPTPQVLRMLGCCISTHFFQQTCGIDAVVTYSPRIFEKVGVSGTRRQLYMSILVGAVKTSSVFVASLTLDRVGRRPLILTSFLGMVIAIFTLGGALKAIQYGDDAKWLLILAIVCLLSFVALFSLGAGPMTYVYSSEIFPLRLRAQACGLGMAVNRLMSGTISMSFLSLNKKVSIGGSFFVYGSVAALGWLVFLCFFPETKGKNLEEVEELFTDEKWNKKKAKIGFWVVSVYVVAAVAALTTFFLRFNRVS